MPDNRATETEDKLILLSMIDGLGGCTREQLMRFALEADLMAQFRFLLALGDLLEDSLVREAETEERVMVLTPEGRETLRLFGETIRPSAAQRIRDNVPRWRTRFRDERQLPAEWQRTQDGFCVTLRALEGGEEPIRRRQRRDACDALEKLDVKKIRPGSMKKAFLAALGCAAVLGILLLVPSPQDSTAEANKALSRTLKEGREAVARAAEEDEASLSEEKKSELRKITGDLERELNESRDAADAMVALDRAEQRLEQMRQQTAGDAAAAADNAAGKNGTGNGENGQQAGTADGNAAAEASAQAGSGQQGTSSATASLTDAQMKTLEALAALKNAVNPSAQQGMSLQGITGMQGGTPTAAQLAEWSQRLTTSTAKRDAALARAYAKL